MFMISRTALRVSMCWIVLLRFLVSHGFYTLGERGIGFVAPLKNQLRLRRARATIDVCCN